MKRMTQRHDKDQKTFMSWRRWPSAIVLVLIAGAGSVGAVYLGEFGHRSLLEQRESQDEVVALGPSVKQEPEKISAKTVPKTSPQLVGEGNALGHHWRLEAYEATVEEENHGSQAVCLDWSVEGEVRSGAICLPQTGSVFEEGLEMASMADWTNPKLAVFVGRVSKDIASVAVMEGSTEVATGTMMAAPSEWDAPYRFFLAVVGVDDAARMRVEGLSSEDVSLAGDAYTGLPRVFVSLAGKGSGVVTGQRYCSECPERINMKFPLVIDCGGDCWTEVDEYSAIKLWAKPSPGSHFSGWSGACKESTECVIDVYGQTQQVTAHFEPTS